MSVNEGKKARILTGSPIELFSSRVFVLPLFISLSGICSAGSVTLLLLCGSDPCGSREQTRLVRDPNRRLLHYATQFLRTEGVEVGEKMGCVFLQISVFSKARGAESSVMCFYSKTT